MLRIQVTHAQKRYGQTDDAPKVDVLAAKSDGSEGVYFTSLPESTYRWGCSRTYRTNVGAALREFMYENGQTLIKFEEL
jgi:hypothetical protein